MKFTGIALLAYDADLIEESISSYVGIVDELLVGLDESRETWSGQKFELAPGIMPRLCAISNKVRIVEDMYFVPGLSPLDNDTRERNMLAAHSPDTNWFVSLDSDEILINADSFRGFLTQCRPDACVMGRAITVYKECSDSYLVIGKNGQIDLSPIPLATDVCESFIAARYTKQERVMSPALVLHFTWARSEAELRRKFANWGHRDDFNTDEHLKLWMEADDTTASRYKNFHPLSPEAWPELIVVPKNALKSISEEIARGNREKVGVMT